MEESEPAIAPVRPSISEGERTTRALQSNGSLLTIIDRLEGMLAQCMKQLGKTTIKLPVFETDCGPRITAKVVGSDYVIEERRNTVGS
jgi:hypothetical protein